MAHDKEQIEKPKRSDRSVVEQECEPSDESGVPTLEINATEKIDSQEYPPTWEAVLLTVGLFLSFFCICLVSPI